jgi:endonuclease/exonuclease/phosphatase family metal-dependent hydrolase
MRSTERAKSSLPTPSRMGTAVRVMTYNILFGGVGREALIREAISTVSPDIAVFCEVTARTSFEAIASTVGRHCAQSGSGRERVAIVSRWPIVNADLFGPPWTSQKWIAATIQPDDGPPVRVLAAHLVPQPLWPFEILRVLQIRRLLRQLRSHAGLFQILAGDFNALAHGDPVRRDGAPLYIRAQWWIQGGMIPRWALGRLTAAGYVDCYRACHPKDEGFTVLSWEPHARIDYLFASPALTERLRSADVQRGNVARRPTFRRTMSQLAGSGAISDLGGQASDHLPVWADFEWPPVDDRRTCPTQQTLLYSSNSDAPSVTSSSDCPTWR